MEDRAPVRVAGVTARQGIDADAVLEVLVGPDALDDHDTALLAGAGLDVDDDGSALVADGEPVADADTEILTVVRVQERRRAAVRAGASWASP